MNDRALLRMVVAPLVLVLIGFERLQPAAPGQTTSAVVPENEQSATPHEPKRSVESQAQKPPANETPEAAIRRLIPAAAGMRNADLVGFEDRPLRYDRVEDKRLTLLLFLVRPFPKELYPQQSPGLSKEFDVPQGPIAAPKLFEELSRSRQLGYWSMIQPDRITALTCHVDAEVARGSVSFKVPDMYEGKAQYTARHSDRGWEITEFEMPAHRWRCVRTERGTWIWFNRVGPMDTYSLMKLLQPVAGKVTFRGQSVKEASLKFYHAEDPYLSGASYLDAGGEGRYETSLFVGSYHVVIEDSQPQVPERYRTPGRSGLRIDVQEGKNTFDFHFQE